MSESSEDNSGPPDSDDASLFRATVGDVKRLSDDRVFLQSSKRPRPVPRARADVAARDANIELNGYRAPYLSQPLIPEDFSVVDGDTPLDYAKAGVATKTRRRLKRGYFPVESELDLHGMTGDQASAAYDRFVGHAFRSQYRCVRIIHGKGSRSEDGRAIIKTRVNHWLRTDGRVIAFCSAPRAVGGTGALHILLKLARD